MRHSIPNSIPILYFDVLQLLTCSPVVVSLPCVRRLSVCKRWRLCHHWCVACGGSLSGALHVSSSSACRGPSAMGPLPPHFQVVVAVKYLLGAASRCYVGVGLLRSTQARIWIS